MRLTRQTLLQHHLNSVNAVCRMASQQNYFRFDGKVTLQQILDSESFGSVIFSNITNLRERLFFCFHFRHIFHSLSSLLLYCLYLCCIVMLSIITQGDFFRFLGIWLIMSLIYIHTVAFTLRERKRAGICFELPHTHYKYQNQKKALFISWHLFSFLHQDKTCWVLGMWSQNK